MFGLHIPASWVICEVFKVTSYECKCSAGACTFDYAMVSVSSDVSGELSTLSLSTSLGYEDLSIDGRVTVEESDY